MESFEFYAVCAQVIPVLIVAVVWESQYLERLKTDPRPESHRIPWRQLWRRDGWRHFWTKRRVRRWARITIGTSCVGEALTLLVLAGLHELDHIIIQLVVLAGIFALMASLTTRVLVAVDDATIRKG